MHVNNRTVLCHHRDHRRSTRHVRRSLRLCCQRPGLGSKHLVRQRCGKVFQRLAVAPLARNTHVIPNHGLVRVLRRWKPRCLAHMLVQASRTRGGAWWSHATHAFALPPIPLAKLHVARALRCVSLEPCGSHSTGRLGLRVVIWVVCTRTLSSWPQARCDAVTTEGGGSSACSSTGSRRRPSAATQRPPT